MEKVSKIAVALTLLISLGIMATVSLQESGIMDELAHIPAGYGYVRYLDYRLNPEHPPIVKMLAALPLLFLKVNFPTNSLAWVDDVNGQWATGAQFLYESDNNADQIIKWARLGPMLITLTLALFVYIWSRELLGPLWALLPTAITALTPTVLAHGHYVTTDVGAALGTFVAIYYFVKYLNSPSRKHLVWAGIALGVALLMKFSTVLLIPFFILIALVLIAIDSYQTRKGADLKQRLQHLLAQKWRYGKALFFIFLIGFLVVYPLYFATTIHYPPAKQHSDTAFILESFAGGPPPAGETCKPMRCLAELNIWMSDKPFLRPIAQYMLGVLMVIQRSAGGNTAYFLGKVSAAGSPLYFPTVYALKEPLPVLILISTALIFSLWRIGKATVKRKTQFTNYVKTHLAEFSMLSFVILYAAWSIKSPLNIGVRHLLPIMPFMYILATAGAKKWVQQVNGTKRTIKLGLISVLALWFLADVALAYPYYLSYFNEFVGTKNGWRYVTDSNYDWGQDLKRLQGYVERNNIEKIAVDYFGAGSPTYYMGEKAVPWSSAKGDPRESGIEWLAVSVNTIQGATAPKAPGFERNPEDEYQWLPNPTEPYARAGTSIFIYKLR